MITAQTQSQTALPLGRRVPSGSSRWYLVACERGKELNACKAVKRIVPPELLEDAFVPRTERIYKYHGMWIRPVRVLFKGYFVVVTKNAPALSRALAKISFPVHMVGGVGQGYAPIDEDARAFLAASMDEKHVIRSSEGEIVNDQLHVNHGPLIGEESRVSRFIRRKAVAFVRLGNEKVQTFSLAMPLAILTRR